VESRKYRATFRPFVRCIGSLASRCSEGELRGMFNQHGKVQTCIVNKEKRHAFVKMLTRRDAVAAKEAMENSQYRVSRPRAPVPHAHR
jgi:hypothetical protein